MFFLFNENALTKFCQSIFILRLVIIIKSFLSLVSGSIYFAFVFYNKELLGEKTIIIIVTSLRINHTGCCGATQMKHTETRAFTNQSTGQLPLPLAGAVANK